ncbi:conserved unknown protein [Ectocarpus siliculosus]|uniref:Cyclic nucleotide-binding domain-containing protein n=1 Tax=Ectocarpus siliculosus TaxID=2880 RepID=D8LD28_ECTSI|nr:conserved unknown protein [Ectocarpus siliculosus]|eukprot:CBN78395.1 conserved unknown protein [Ectocarpus siliculosus]
MGPEVQQGAARLGEGGVLKQLRDAMVKERRPLQFMGCQTTTTASNQCGHLSFVILALAYLETDVLALRASAASGIGLSILFQFYRAQPLWIPIGWNGVFLLINVSMIGLLLKEKSEAAHIGDDPEQARTFQEVFAPVELTPVDFVRLMDLAERRLVAKGTHLSEEGQPQEEVFLIVEGAAEVEAESAAVGHLEQKQFVGSMAFNRFMQASASPTTTSPTVPTDISSTSTSSSSSGGDAEEQEDASIDDEYEPGVYYTDDDEDGYIVADSSDNVPGGGGVFKEAKEVALNVLRRDSIVGSMAQSFVADAEGDRRHGGGQMERSATTVTATTDVVAYVWDMHLLRAFIKRRPLAGAALQNAISADLTRKVDQSRGPEERYRLLLAEALDGGVITPIEKKKLTRYRDMHGISSEEHRELLKEHEWTKEEFEAGFQKGVTPRDGSKHFLNYEALLRRELAKGKVEDDGRQSLREFRTRAGIDAQEHLIALEKQGWTADDYEVGAKGKAAACLAGRSVAEQPDNTHPVRVPDDGQDDSTDKRVVDAATAVIVQTATGLEKTDTNKTVVEESEEREGAGGTADKEKREMVESMDQDA